MSYETLAYIEIPDTTSINPAELSRYEIALNLPVIAGIIRQARTAQKLSLPEASAASGVKPSRLSGIENRGIVPSRQDLIRLGETLNIDCVDQLQILAGHQPLYSDEVQH
jgi:hypothetical protein